VSANQVFLLASKNSMSQTQNKKELDDTISHYRLTELLVAQMVSAIYLAQDEKTGEQVFLVTLQPDASRSSDLAERFQRRAETLAQLEHAVIPPLLDYGVDGKRPYAVMSHFSGQFLATYLENVTKSVPDDKVKVIESLKLAKQIAAGLAVTHPNGLIHHDLRPENIYLDESGQPFLLDMVVPPTPPIATQIGDASLTELDFQSPEQIAGKALSGRSNIYSVGILLYRLLAGQKPPLPVSDWDIFDHKGLAREIPLNQVRPDLTAATYRVVQDSIWQKEWSRYETVDAQLAAIEHAIVRESAPPPPPPPVWRLVFNRLRQPKIVKIIIPVIVFLILLFLMLMLIRGRANRQRNLTPTPDAVILPVEVETAAIIEPSEPTIQPSTQTTATPVETSKEIIGEGEVLPPGEETDTPTPQPIPIETTVPAIPTLTASPTPQTTSTLPPTNTPTTEPTQTSCIITPPFGWARYTIQANDSLSLLGEATNTTVEQLKQVNCLDSILLSIGQQIWLPALEPTATVTEPASTSESATAVPPSPVPPGPNPTQSPPTPTVPPPSP
jgi:serine/threonine protein kinase